MYIHICTRTYKHAYICIYMYIYMNTYIYIYTTHVNRPCRTHINGSCFTPLCILSHRQNAKNRSDASGSCVFDREKRARSSISFYSRVIFLLDLQKEKKVNSLTNILLRFLPSDARKKLDLYLFIFFWNFQISKIFARAQVSCRVFDRGILARSFVSRYTWLLLFVANFRKRAIFARAQASLNFAQISL